MAEIEFLILANHAEAINGLVYISGGGWTDHWRGPQQPGTPAAPSRLGIAVGVRVPWTETNRNHHLTIRIENEDSTVQLGTVEGDLEVGRPAGSVEGSDQRAVLALNANIVFPVAGGYRIVAELSKGNSRRSVSFRVHDRDGP